MQKEDNTPQFDHLELLSPGWINKYILTYQAPDGTMFGYESVSRKGPQEYERLLRGYSQGTPPIPDAVAIVPLVQGGEVLLIREFRYPVNSYCVAFPAGLIDPGENFEESVRRELLEETGYRVSDSRRPLYKGQPGPIVAMPQSGFTSVGFTEENVQIVFAFAEKAGEPSPEAIEHIEPFTIKLNEIDEFLATNTTPIGTRAQLLLEILSAYEKLGVLTCS